MGDLWVNVAISWREDVFLSSPPSKVLGGALFATRDDASVEITEVDQALRYHSGCDLRSAGVRASPTTTNYDYLIFLFS